jgi:CRP-like cAMP-binding protein
VALRRLVEQHPPLSSAFLAHFSTQLRHLVDLVDRLALHTVQGRLARLLLDQADATASGEPLPPLTQSDMAARLGTVREMVARTLKGFEVQGLIRLDHGAITVLDKQGLAAQAEH